MYLNLETIKRALSRIEFVHPILGITFLVCKQERLPVGQMVGFSIDKAQTAFLDRFFKPENSQHYYRVFRTSDLNRHWLAHDYASKSLQRMRTSGDTSRPFLHEKRTDLWGWAEDYVRWLKALLPERQSIPAFDLAAWLFRDREWPSNTTPQDIIEKFVREFRLTAGERRALFDEAGPTGSPSTDLFQDVRVSWEDLQEITGPPPDAPKQEGGTLAALELHGVGPARNLRLEPAERLNLITGDNGLGKTFLLECAWWALTGHWAGLPAHPISDIKRNDPTISFAVANPAGRAERITISYDWDTRSWPSPRNRPTIPGLLIYARVGGSFALWDPAKSYLSRNLTPTESFASEYFVLSEEQVWDGMRPAGSPQIIEGLLRDWVRWQSKSDRSTFETLTKVLNRLSPKGDTDLGPLIPSEPTRLPGIDPREIPTLKHPYGEVPIVFASAGVRRIITLAYILVWAWEEHKVHSALQRREPQTRMVILIDEMEAHLHPQWQRVILPAILDVREDLATNLQVQVLIATHSPLVMASVEPRFDDKKDRLFHLNLVRSTLHENEVVLEELPFIRNGVIDNWLVSEVFELKQPRSLEAEEAIARAKQLQLQGHPDPDEVKRISEELVRVLSPEDGFWPRWTYFAEQPPCRRGGTFIDENGCLKPEAAL